MCDWLMVVWVILYVDMDVFFVLVEFFCWFEFWGLFVVVGGSGD